MELIVFCGPSGAGKTTLTRKLVADFPSKFSFCVSHTTRKQRLGEMEGVDYYFVDIKTFQNLEFYEKLVYGESMYGTSKLAIGAIAKSGKLPILDVNIDSIEALKAHTKLKITTIFIKPNANIDETLKILEGRLKTRSKETMETEETIYRRLKISKEELERAEEMIFDFELINNNLHLEDAYDKLKNILSPFMKKKLSSTIANASLKLENLKLEKGCCNQEEEEEIQENEEKEQEEEERGIIQGFNGNNGTMTEDELNNHVKEEKE